VTRVPTTSLAHPHRIRRGGSALVVGVALVVLAACSGSDDRADRTTTSSRATTTTSAPAATTTTTVARGLDLESARFRLTRLAPVSGPTGLAVRAGDTTLYVAEQRGRVRAFRDGGFVDAPVLDISSITSSGGERGLLGLAFSPDGAHLYVNHTNRDGDTRVAEYAMRPDGTADPDSRREVLAIDQPQPNHNGGDVAFGPDGMLYVATGDGGGGGDQGDGHASGGNGQSKDTLLGKLLRIDPTPSGGRQYTIPPDNPFAAGGGRPEIWHFGLRNPWRFSFDRATGDLVIADVGQNAYEEINWVAAGTPGGLNFGWNIREGKHPYRDGPTDGLTDPVLEYPQDDGRCAVTGGYVYRGTQIPGLAGAYLYSDSCSGSIRGTPIGPGIESREVDFGIDGGQVVAFGQDGSGELYVLSQSQGLLKVDPA
jgi:glucose/arabinose dehydrogenase